MRWRQLRAYLFPAKADPLFKEELRGLSRSGLRVLGGIEIAVAVFTLGAQVLVETDRDVIAGMAAQAVAVAFLGVLTILSASMPWARRRARRLSWISGWLVPATLIFSSLLLTPNRTEDEHFLFGQIAIILLGVVAATPLLPLQTVSLGLGISLFYGICSIFSGWDPSVQTMILMLTFLTAGVSALIYAQRLSTFEAHQQALQTTEILSNAQSRALLSETAVSVGRLAAALTHEINSPLGALKSGIDTMLVIAARQANAKPEEHTRFVAIQADLRKSILASAERLSNVIARLQRLVNLENQEKKETDLNELLKDVTVVFEPELRDGVQIAFDLEPVRPVPCNTQQMSAVISTLVSNGLKAIDGKGRISVFTVQRNSDIELRIQDNGRGMKSEDVSTAFDPGFKVLDGRVLGGNWGMFTARQIIHEHGGDITIDSQEGEGTTVIITLPCTPEGLTMPAK